jgi:hypothetical protein
MVARTAAEDRVVPFSPPNLDRRRFLRLGTALWSSALLVATPWERALAALRSGNGPYGPLGAPDANGIQLPAGFQSRVVAGSGQLSPGSGYRWHRAPDGGATFHTRDGGWIYVSNSELSSGGGVGALRFDRGGDVMDAYPILEGTRRNCAGGATPWRSWLSCEEVGLGQVYECEPEGNAGARLRPALGTFKHEAAAVDPRDSTVYMTEDERDGCFYRFLPNAWGNLGGGQLQLAELSAGQVVWHDVPDPQVVTGVPTRRQLSEAAPFNGGEGIVHSHGHLFFTTKGDNRIWDYELARSRMSVLYAPTGAPGLPLRGVDNITASRRGDLIVAEDGGNMELVMITRGPFGRGPSEKD